MNSEDEVQRLILVFPTVNTCQKVLRLEEMQ